MTVQEVLQQLEQLGTEQNRKIYTNHGCDIPLYGVSTANLKKVLKPIKKDLSLGRDLLFSNNMDAMYLSQWIVDLSQLTVEDLENRILVSHFYLLIENAIPNIIATDIEFAQRCIKRWLHHEEARFRQAAYSLYAIVLSVYPNEHFDLNELRDLLRQIESTIHQEENRVRYTMNGFVIAVGAYIESLHELAKQTANNIGVVTVNMGKTACKVPFGPTYLAKIAKMNRVGQKRKL